jgi:hypothetical protein
MIKRLSVLCCAIVAILMAACDAVSPHQIYKYSRFPDPPFSTAHLDQSCQASVHRLHGGETIQLVWTAAPVSISGTPVISYEPMPVTLQIRVILIGPYKSCSTFHDAVSQDGTVKGPVATALPEIITDNWHATTFKQSLPLPATSGYYILSEQRWQSRSETSKKESFDQSLSWIQVNSRNDKNR